jgi:hypothetical protein
LSATAILDGSLTGKHVVQEFRPFPESLEWELGLRYYQKQGSKAFIQDAEPIPYAINNDGWQTGVRPRADSSAGATTAAARSAAGAWATMEGPGITTASNTAAVNRRFMNTSSAQKADPAPIVVPGQLGSIRGAILPAE